MIGWVVESLPGEMDAASARGVDKGFPCPCVRLASGRRDTLERGVTSVAWLRVVGRRVGLGHSKVVIG